MALFVDCCRRANLANATVVDMGGTPKFWNLHQGFIPEGMIQEVDVVNLPVPNKYTPEGRIEMAGKVQLNIYSGNALDRSTFRQPQYDIAHSISVIEHVGEHDAQALMAQNAVQSGKHYWIQTPAKSFPLEPHFMLPFFAYWPLWMRALAIRNFQLGSQHQDKTWSNAKEHCRSIRLLSRPEVRNLFAGGVVVTERLLGIKKGYIATNMPIDVDYLKSLNGDHFSYTVS